MLKDMKNKDKKNNTYTEISKRQEALLDSNNFLDRFHREGAKRFNNVLNCATDTSNKLKVINYAKHRQVRILTCLTHLNTLM